jgi:aminocarboxymuconate-semialdehyde decarboxylase
MPSRRNFLRAAGGVTAGLAAGVLTLKPAFAQGRKQVSIGGQRVKTVDIHAHAAIQAVEDVIRGTAVERRIGGPRLLGPDRIAMMDSWGIDVSVLSINQYWWYDADRELAARITRVQDEGLAQWCQAHSDRFVGLSTVALQYPDLAAEQLEYAVKQLGLRGASIGGHVLGEVPSSEKYDVFWRKAEELGAPIFMHPGGAENVLRENGLDGRGDLGNIIGNPLETTVFLTHLIFDGTLDRFPNLKICGAHGGGFLPSYFGRTDIACEVRDDAGCLNQKSPREYLRSQVLADSMVFTAEALRHLVAEMGASQVVYGTDMPLGWPDTMDLIVNADFLSNDEKVAILGGNLMRLLRIPA